MKRLLWLLVLGVTLAGCQVDAEIDLYLSDIRALAQGDKANLTTRALLEIYIPSAKKCDEYTDQIVSILERYFETVDPRGCKDSALGDSLLVDAYLPMVASDEQLTDLVLPHNGFIGLAVVDRPNDQRIDVWIVFIQERMNLLSKEIEGEFGQDIEFDIGKIFLRNDEEATAEVFIFSSFADGRPFPTEGQISLRRRNSIEITLSDVALAYILETGPLSVLAISRSTD